MCPLAVNDRLSANQEQPRREARLFPVQYPSPPQIAGGILLRTSGVWFEELLSQNSKILFSILYSPSTAYVPPYRSQQPTPPVKPSTYSAYAPHFLTHQQQREQEIAEEN